VSEHEGRSTLLVTAGVVVALLLVVAVVFGLMNVLFGI
jgi:hypothetical protein